MVPVSKNYVSRWGGEGGGHLAQAELASVHLVGEAVLLAVGAGEGEAVEAHLLRSSSTCSQSVAVVIVAIDSVGIVSVAIVNVGIVSR